jgi:transcriptional regulator with XRE-family HTH domain
LFTTRHMVKTLYTLQHMLLLQRLKEAREAMGMTQAVVARRMSKPQSFVAKYEAGERRLDVIELIKLAELLQINTVDLIDELSTLEQK